MSRSSGKKAIKWRLSAVLTGVLAFAATATAIFVFQDNLIRFSMNPRTPYQTVAPPAAPSYDARDAWLLLPDAEAEARIGDADVFYVHSSTYYSARSWNAPLRDGEADRLALSVAAPNEAGPFSTVGPIFGPRYRQATLYAQFTHKYDGLAARKTAFSDVEAAFEEFLRRADDPERPFILAGYGQGGLHVLGLLQTRIANSDELKARLAVAYIIGHAVAPEFFTQSAPTLRPCRDAEDFRCIVGYVDYEANFDAQISRARKRDLVWSAASELREPSGEPPLCINPLSWTDAEGYVDAERHIGAASATGLLMGQTPSAVSRAIGARCDRGILIVDTPTQSYLRRKRWFGAQWKVRNFNLFYHDLAADAERRAARARVKLFEEATILDPIVDAVDLVDNPVNKVPNE